MTFLRADSKTTTVNTYSKNAWLSASLMYGSATADLLVRSNGVTEPWQNNCNHQSRPTTWQDSKFKWPRHVFQNQLDSQVIMEPCYVLLRGSPHPLLSYPAMLLKTVGAWIHGDQNQQKNCPHSMKILFLPYNEKLSPIKLQYADKTVTKCT